MFIKNSGNSQDSVQLSFQVMDKVSRYLNHSFGETARRRDSETRRRDETARRHGETARRPNLGGPKSVP